MKILVVDDHPLVLQGICITLELNGHQVIQALDIEQALEALNDYFDVLLLDYNLQTIKGTDLFANKNFTKPGKTILISGITDPDIILYLLETTPVDAFVSKQLDPEELVNVVEQVGKLQEDESFFWQEAQKKFIKARDAFPKNQILTPKEREVFMLLRQGMLDKQIADQLQRSIHTIRVQIRSIKRKRGGGRRFAETDY